MKIVCKVIRPGGSLVEMPDGKKYNFKPSPDDEDLHIADVADKAHQAILLAIREAYVPLDQINDPVPDEELAPLPEVQAVESWSNKKTMTYAKEVLGLKVPEDKTAILAMAEAHGLKLDARKGASPMLRALIAHIGIEDDELTEE
mgnify:FL=1|jgi:hypothetical protein